MDNTTLMMIIVIIAIIIMYIIYKYNKNKLEHFELSTEAVKNLTNTCKQEEITYNTGNFNNLTATNINTNNIISSKNGILDNVTVANLDVSNNFTGRQGKFNTVKAMNLYGNVTAETGNFTNLTTTNLNSTKLNLDNVNVTKLCFTPTNCITKDMINSMLLLDSPITSYMYLPNTPTQTYNIIRTSFEDTTNIYTFDPSNNPTSIKLKNGSRFVEAAGENMTILTTGIWGTPSKRVIRSNNTVTTSKSGDKKQSNSEGLKIIVPQKPSNMPRDFDFTVLWIQVTNKLPELWQTFRVYDIKPGTTELRNFYGKYCGGGNKLNNIDPDGAASKDEWDKFEWIPVPIDLSGNTNRELYISNFLEKDTLFSGFAFSANPWNHAKSSALNIHWGVNNDDTLLNTDASNNLIGWNGIDNNIHKAVFQAGKTFQFRIPFVNSGRNKIFYIVVFNEITNPATGIISLDLFTNNDVPLRLGNFYTSFDNPFSRHFNSKQNLRYIGVVIPKEYLPPVTQNFLKFKMTVAQTIGIPFAEVGTHDENPFD